MANEKRLIDADAIEKHCRNTKIIELFPEWKDFPCAMKNALIRYGKEWKKIIQNAPTVDAVEVVRCKDCEHSKPITILNENRVQLHCRMQYGFPCVEPDEYCSRGERREGE